MLQVWDSDGGWSADDKLSKKQKVVLSPGNHKSNRLEAFEGGHFVFDYNFDLDGDECINNPCQHGGTCEDKCSSYTCKCTSTYTGENCEKLHGKLRVKARHARNLQDKDPWWNESDPYMKVIAYDADGGSVTKSSSIKNGDQSPDWNQWLDFEKRAWKSFKIQVLDSDYNADDPLSGKQTVTLKSHGSKTSQRHECYGDGYAIFDYSFE